MPAKTGLPSRSIGRHFKSKHDGWTKGVGVIPYVWLAFYIFAVTSSLLSQRPAAPVATADALQTFLLTPSH